MTFFPRCTAKTFPIYLLKTSAVIHPVGLCPALQSSGTPCVISDGIHWYGYTSMGGHIIPEAEEANSAVMGGFVRQPSISHIFLSPLQAKTLPFFAKNWNLSYHHWKFLLGLEECATIFHLLRHLQSAAAYNWKRKICYVGKHRLPKKSTIINSCFIIFWYLHSPVWHSTMRLYCH